MAFEAALCEKPDALLAISLFGQAFPDEILNKARQKGLMVVEDAAQSFGVQNNLAQLSTLSFDPSKVIFAGGTAGAVCSNDVSLIERIKSLRYHGKLETDFTEPGFNSRISSLNAAFLLYQISVWPTIREERHRVAHQYHSELYSTSDLRLLPLERNFNFHKFVIHTKYRDGLKQHLAGCGIETAIHYSKPLYQYTLCDKFRPEQALPQTELWCTEALSLPIYPELTAEETGHVCQSINQYFEKLC
jgi:dTDP-4-amino-4,6-dideoxygalactose transaminase